MFSKVALMFLILALLSPAIAVAAPSIVPKPVSMKTMKGVFTLDADTRILVSSESALPEAEYCGEVLRPATGLTLNVGTAAKAKKNTIYLALNADMEGVGTEGYRLEVSRKKVIIEAPSRAGLFYGIQTLRQLLPPEIYQGSPAANVDWTIPCVEIEDMPRFSWRGMHLDVCRHFFPKEFVKKYIDTLALHKFNQLHIHFSDDQGWRVEIKKYPKLTEIGAWRKQTIVGNTKEYDGVRHGGFYSQEDIRELVAYGQSRYVTIVPEIEMPGHAQAAIASYPELGNLDTPLPVKTEWGGDGNIFNVEESTILFLQDVLAEVMELFPSEFIHIGGDEAAKGQWEDTPRIQERMKELGIEDEHALQSWFIKRMDTFIASKGRRLIGWDEILEGGLAPGATVMSWRSDKGGIAAARAGHDVVMAASSHTYFDYYQAKPSDEPLAIGGNLPLDVVYGFNPVPEALTEEEAKHILGAQGQLWTEYISTPEYLEYMAFPRGCALAEVVWTPDADKDWADFLTRLQTHVKRLDGMKVNYKKELPEK